MKTHLSILILLLFFANIFAQKKQISTKINNPKHTTLKTKKTIIPEDYQSILDLLQNGKISFYEVYSSQVDIINKIQKSIFNKQKPVQKGVQNIHIKEEKQIIFYTILPVDNPVMLNFYDKSISFISSEKSEKSEVLKTIFPKINFEINSDEKIEVAAYKEIYGETSGLIIVLPKKIERVVLDEKGNILPYPYTRKEGTVYFDYPSNSMDAQKKLLNAFKNIILLANSDDEMSKIPLQVTTTEDEKGIHIVFKRES